MRRRVEARVFERVSDEDLYEVIEEEEMEAGGDEEVILEDEEIVEEGKTVVGRPEGDPVAEYLYGLTNEQPVGLGEWSVLRLLSELRRAETLGDQRRARRAARLIYTFCPAKPSLCPMYSLTLKCPYGLEKRCRGFAYVEKRRIEKPRKWRGWYQRGRWEGGSENGS
jgi:hypothetical protein